MIVPTKDGKLPDVTNETAGALASVLIMVFAYNFLAGIGLSFSKRR